MKAAVRTIGPVVLLASALVYRAEYSVGAQAGQAPGQAPGAGAAAQGGAPGAPAGPGCAGPGAAGARGGGGGRGGPSPGQTLYTDQCSGCHGVDASGRHVGDAIELTIEGVKKPLTLTRVK